MALFGLMLVLVNSKRFRTTSTDVRAYVKKSKVHRNEIEVHVHDPNAVSSDVLVWLKT